MFFEDALTASRELEITLTGKDCGLEERAPMCGVPFHAAETYINRLIEKGYKVAICEQVEDPKKAKGLVKREVVRIVTPGTTLDTMSLDESKNNYLMSIVSIGDHFGCAIADITTGDCFLTELDKPQKLLDEINKFTPAEIICNDAFLLSGVDVADLKGRLGICVFALDPWYFDDQLCQKTLKEHFHVGNLEGLGIGDYDSGIIASGALFLYLKETQKTHFPIWQASARTLLKNICSSTAPAVVTLSLWKPCAKSRKEVLFSGFWIRPKPPWVPEPFVLMWNSL